MDPARLPGWTARSFRRARWRCRKSLRIGCMPGSACRPCTLFSTGRFQPEVRRMHHNGAAMTVTFRTKLLASHVGLVAAIVLLVIAVLDVSLSADLERQLDDRLLQQALGAAQWI